jgi:outer membrane protein OmpA-like peptidoglycan-associated protein
VALAALVFGASATPGAQEFGGPVDPDIVVQRFTPVTGPHGIITVDGSRSQGHLKVASGLMLNYSTDPLVLVQGGMEPVVIVEQQLVGDLLFSIGLFDVAEVGLSLPLYGVNTATIGEEEISGVTVGDVRLRPKFTLLDREDSPIGIALIAHLTLPTGDDAAFTSSGGVSGRPGVVADVGNDDVLFAVNLSFDLHQPRDFGNLEIGSEFLFALGVDWQFVDDVYLGTELFGSTVLNDAFVKQNSPLEGVIGLEFRGPANIRYSLGTGAGIVGGYGAPAYRVFAGIQYAEDLRDTDGDGLYDDVDKCIDDPEDKDQFEDDDGCPDPDNDADGIPDVDDGCPLEPEDFDGFEDENGCPDPDNDADGVLDTMDGCPLTPGPASNEGCPIIDSDKDGLMDDVDDCPLEPEDKDGFQDEDGCPDPDNDRDGVLDAADECPNEPETINGFKDEDGCPDKGKARVVLVANEIRVLDRVYFDTGKATIKQRSFSLLDQVVLVLRANQQVEVVEVQGHTDDRGGDAFNLKLSDDRARSVYEYLVGKGIPKGRLKSKGYGETSPAVEFEGLRGRRLKRAREKNRRVQFLILKQSPVEVPIE